MANARSQQRKTIMSMEHRHSTDIMVTIAYAPLGIINARVTQLCSDSIHIDTGPIYLHPGQRVEVFFRQADGQLLSRTALTRHSRLHGSLLQFSSEDVPHQVTDIQHPLYCANGAS